MKRWLTLVLSMTMLLSLLLLPTSLGGIREAEAASNSLDGCTEYPLQAYAKLTSNVDLKEYPNASSDTVHAIKTSENTNMSVSGLWKNSSGVFFYKVYAQWTTLTGTVGGTGYVYAGAAEILYAYPKGFSVSSPTYPSEIIKGNSFHIKGTVKSSMYTITGVYAYVYNGDVTDISTATPVISSKVTGLSTKSYSIYNTAVDNNLKFGSLAVGSYKFALKVTFKYNYSKGSSLETASFSYDGKTQWPVATADFKVVNSYTVSYNANGGTGAPSSQTKVKDKDLTLSTKKPTRADFSANYIVTFDANGGSAAQSSASCPKSVSYSFSSWNTASDGSGTAYASGATYKKNASVTLYARWNSSSSITRAMLPTASRTGYTFDGWYTAASGGTRIGGADDSYAPDGDVTLYAHWTPKTYTVTLNANGGSCSTSNMTVTYGQKYGTLPTPTRTGYTFAGWWTTKTTGGKQVTASTVCYASGNYTLYARWTPKTYTVTLNANGGSCSTASITVTYGKAYGTLPTPAERTGYNFNGWWTTKDSGGKQVTASTVCYATGNYTLYARWKTAKTYTVTLNANGGSCSKTSITATYGNKYGTLPTPTRTGYTFKGWWTAKDSGGKQVTASTVCQATGNFTLYARWEAKTYTVTLNANGGTCSKTSITVTYGNAYGTLPTPAERTGYNFAGWWTTKSGDGKQVTASTVCHATGNFTLYARWKTAATYTVSFNANGGYCETGSKTITYGNKYGTLPTATRSGYTFAGWWTTKATGGKQVAASTVSYASGNFTLYARWTAN